MLRRRNLSSLVLFLLTFSLFLPLPASAREAPVPPAAYYGRVYLNGEPAPAGTTVVAKIDNQERGEISVVEAGYYGGAGVLEPKLIVQGSSTDQGKLVSFFLRYQVAGKEMVAEAKEKVPFTVGAVQSLNLSADPAPVVVATDPANGAANVPVDKAITATFSEKVTSGAPYDRIVLKDAAGGSVSITKRIEGGVLSLKATSNLAYSTKYTVTIPAGAIQDLTGNALAQEYTFSFTTQAAPVTPPSGGGGVPGGGGGGGGGGAALPVTPTIPEQPPAGEKVEKPVQPGTTTVAEVPGVVKVEVPPGAVTGTNPVVKAEVVSEAKTAGAGMPVISHVVDVTVVNGTLTGEVAITLYFDKSKLNENQEPVAHYYDEQANKWVPVEGMVDLGKGTVTVKVSHLTIFAVFAVAKETPKPEMSKPTGRAFVDMAGHWAEETVAQLASRGIVSGYPDGTFRPNQGITRTEATAILARALSLAPETEEALWFKFKDWQEIPEWARGTVAAAVKEGIISGYPDGKAVVFKGARQITRTELTAVVARVLVKKLGRISPAKLAFADEAKIPLWAKQAVGIAVARGVVSGYPDNTFRGERSVTRAEAASMILRLLEAIEVVTR